MSSTKKDRSYHSTPNTTSQKTPIIQKSLPSRNKEKQTDDNNKSNSKTDKTVYDKRF